jgi:hypothetical protein
VDGRLNSGRAKTFSLLQKVHTGCGTHTAPYSVGTGVISGGGGGKRPGLDVERSAPSSVVVVKDKWSYTSSPTLCLRDVLRVYLYVLENS